MSSILNSKLHKRVWALFGGPDLSERAPDAEPCFEDEPPEPVALADKIDVKSLAAPTTASNYIARGLAVTVVALLAINAYQHAHSG
jgi:hypothetical protein